MFSKVNLISTLVATVWGVLGGTLLWGYLVDPYLQDHQGTATGVMKQEPDFAPMIIGALLAGFAFSTLFGKWSRGKHSTSEGAKFGIWIGILIGLGDRIIEYGVANVLDLNGTIVNALTYVLFFLIMGILTSMIYKKFSSKSD